MKSNVKGFPELIESLGEENTKKLLEGWVRFSNEFENFIYKIDSCYVNLHFEHVFDDDSVYTFEPDEVIFSLGFAFNARNEPCVKISFGPQYKYFSFDDSQLVICKDLNDEQAYPLYDKIKEIYEHSFKGVTGFETMDTITPNCNVHSCLAEVLMTAEDCLEDMNLINERKTKFKDIPNYGIF